jgi:nitrogenase molybdenum-iron protein alpha/beta subunit
VSDAEVVERLERATADAREVLGQLHAAGKDLRKTIRDAQEIVNIDARELVAKVVAVHLNGFEEFMAAQFEKSTTRVVSAFDELLKDAIKRIVTSPIMDRSQINDLINGRQVQTILTPKGGAA